MRWLILSLVLVAGCGTYTVTVPASGRPSVVTTPAVPAEAAGVPLKVSDPEQVTITPGFPGDGPCHVRELPGGDLPDNDCTPGAYDPGVSAEVLCDPAYSTRQYRPPVSQTNRVKWDVVAPAYGIDGRPVSELDHLISLDLAGSNATANLWIEVGTIPNDKDTVERHLHSWVCDGGTAGVRAERLRAAQVAVAANWVTAEAVLGA